MPVPVEHLASIDSTNLEAMRRIARGERGPLWIVAGEQSGGRGRSGRSWVSPPGNFYGSLVMAVDCRPAVAHQLSLLASLGIHDALVEATGARVPGLRLKWPNDVMADRAKLAGLLAESSTDHATGGIVVVFGIGINLVPTATDLGRPVACLAGHGIRLGPDEMAAPLASWIMHWLRLWSGGKGFDTVRSAWLARAGAIGEAIEINAGRGPVAGTFAGLDADGALLMQRPSGVVERFTYGDVTIR